jgi:hypothetical protein
VTAPDDLIILFRLDDPSCCGRCIRRIDVLAALAADGAADVEHEPAAATRSRAGLFPAAVRDSSVSIVDPAPDLALARPGRL